MSRQCVGCGEKLQSTNEEQKGYVKDLKNEDVIYCERCYRLKHYKEMRMDELNLSNEELLCSAEKMHLPIYYFVDLLNLSEESLSFFRKIKGEKTLVLTKIDLIPYSISIDRLRKRIQKVYQIEEEIYALSRKKEATIGQLFHKIEKEKKVLLLGMTNVGKSTFLKELYQKVTKEKSPILISEMPNTTLAFLEWKIGPITIIDAPGFNYQKKLSPDFALKCVPKKYLKPITIQMKKETRINIDNQISISQDLEKNSITFYGSSELSYQKKYKDLESPCYQYQITVPERTDLVLPAIGIFSIRDACTLKLESTMDLSYETRPSLFGGSHDYN